MRRLTTLTVSGRDGFKGWTGSLALHGVDVLAGPNGAGKTTRLDAIQAGLRGLSRTTSPGAGVYVGPKRPRAKVQLDWDDSMSMTRDLSVVQGKAAKLADGQADMLVGRHVTRWDLGDFASSTDKARAELLKGLLGAGGQDWDRAACDRFLREKLPCDEGSAMDDLVLNVLTFWTEHEQAEPWLDDAILWAKTEFSTANGERTQAKKGVEELQQQARERAEAQEGGSLAQVRQRAGEVDQELQQLAGQIATASQAGRAVQAYQEKGARLTKTMGSATESLDRAEAAATKAEARLDEAKQRQEKLEPLEEAKGRLEEAERALASSSEQVKASNAKLEAARRAHQEQRDAVGRAEEAVATLQALAQDASGSCRECGLEDPLGLQCRIEHAQQGVDMEAAKLPRLQLRIRLATRAHERDKMAEANNSLAVQNIHSELGMTTAGHDTARANISRAQELHDLAQAELQRCRKAAEEAELDLQAHQQDQPPQGAAGDLATLEARQAALQQEQQELRTKAETLARDEGGEQALQNALARREKAEARWKAVKALQAALADLQAEVARGAYEPITQHANRLLADAEVPLAVYIEDEGDFGAEVGDKGRVHFASLSDGERALVAASFAYAFTVAAGSPCPMMLLDRLEAIDEDRLEGFLRAVRHAVDTGALANFVGALRWRDVPEDPEERAKWHPPVFDGVEIHWLGSSMGGGEA